LFIVRDRFRALTPLQRVDAQPPPRECRALESLGDMRANLGRYGVATFDVDATLLPKRAICHRRKVAMPNTGVGTRTALYRFHR
jgi:hypothetical protein